MNPSDATFDSLVIRMAITDTMMAYTRAGDSGRVGDFVACFAPDGVLEVKDLINRGHEAIAAFVQDTGRTFASNPSYLPARHHVASIWVETTGPDEARGGAYFALVAADGLDHWGVYRDRFVKIDGRWHFAHRRVKVEGARPGSPEAAMVE